MMNFKNLLSIFVILLLYLVLGVGVFWQQDVLAAEFIPPNKEQPIMVDQETVDEDLIQNTEQPNNISPDLRNRLTQQPNSEIELDPYSAQCSGISFLSNLNKCMANLAVNITGYVVMLFAMLIGGIIDVFIWIIFLIVENILAQNPAQQGGIFWDLAVQIYAVTLNIANLLILFSFYYVGFQYLFGIKKDRMGWQEFLAKVVAATILVNFSLFIVAIFVTVLHDIGQLFVNIFSKGQGTIGGAFQSSVKLAAGYSLDGKNVFSWDNFPSLFSDPGEFYGLILTRLVYVFVTFFILTSLLRLLKVAITRFVLLFLLLIIAPLGVVMLFSPIKVLKDQGDTWMKTLWTQAILYPFFVIALSIGTVFIAGFIEAVEANKEAAFNKNDFAAQMPRIMALLVAYGVVKVIADWFEKSFEGIASDTWNAMKKGAFAAGGALGMGAGVGLGLIKGIVGGGSKGIRQGYNKFSGGGTGFGARAKGIIGGALGGIAGSTLGAAKESMNVGRHLKWARRGAFGLGAAMDKLGGKESVVNEMMNQKGFIGKILRASGAASKKERDNYSALLGKKFGSGLHKGMQKIGLGELANYWNVEKSISDIVDIFNPNSIYRGRFGDDLPDKGTWLRQIEADARNEFRKGIGLDAYLTGNNVLNTLKNIMKRTRKLDQAYLNNPQDMNEIAEAIMKSPSIIRKFDARMIEMFQANYKQMADSIEDWDKFVRENAPILADEATREQIAMAHAKEGIAAIRQGKIPIANFEDPVYAKKYVEEFKNLYRSTDRLKELSKLLGKDFLSFETESYLRGNGIPAVQPEIEEAVKDIQNRGISDDLKAKIFREVDNNFTDAQLATALYTDIEDGIKNVSERVLRQKLFYNDSQHEYDINNATDEVKLRQLMEQNDEARRFLENWEKANGQLTNARVNDFKTHYSNFVNTIINGYKANDVAIKDMTNEYIKNSQKYNMARTSRTLAPTPPTGGAPGGAPTPPPGGAPTPPTGGAPGGATPSKP